MITIILLATTQVFAKQKFYKWTDENGNTHYTSTKPEDKKTDEVNVNTNQPAVTNNALKVGPPPTEGSETKSKSYASQRKKQRQKAKATAQDNKVKCQKAKQTVTKFKQQVRMGRVDKNSGETIYLEDSKRTQIINKAQKEVKKYC